MIATITQSEAPPKALPIAPTITPVRNSVPPAMTMEMAMMKIAPRMNLTGCMRLVPVMPILSASRCTI